MRSCCTTSAPRRKRGRPGRSSRASGRIFPSSPRSRAIDPMIRFVAALLFVLAAAQAYGANERVALLIGNNSYGSAPLRNAVNDAKDLGDALKEVGFKVIVRENAS